MHNIQRGQVMTKPKQKEGEFDEWIMGDMYEALTSHTCALEALTELLTSSSLSAFSSETDCERTGSSLRWGLFVLFELYLEKQQKILEDYHEKFNNFDLVILNRGKNQLKTVLQGSCITRAAEVKPLKSAIESFDIVIERGGPLKAEAEELKRKCLERMGNC